MQIPVGGAGQLFFNVDVVSANISLNIALNDVRSKWLLLKYLEDQIAHILPENPSPVRYNRGHSLLEWEYSIILFTRLELQWLHPHFFHMTSDKLFQLFTRARPSQANDVARRTLQLISPTYDYCSELSVK